VRENFSTPPSTRSEILASLQRVEREVADFFGTLDDDELVGRVGDAWTPAEHLRHLNTSVSAVAGGLAVRKLLLRLRFGRARRPSRSYPELREEYLRVLAGGGRASGNFDPPREDLGPAMAPARRAELLERWGRVNRRLREALEGWSERELDRLRLPHPLLGALTVREMLFFTLYHDLHHIEAARKRLPRRQQGSA